MLRETARQDCFDRTPLEVASGTSGLVLATKPNAMQISRKDGTGDVDACGRPVMALKTVGDSRINADV